MNASLSDSPRADSDMLKRNYPRSRFSDPASPSTSFKASFAKGNSSHPVAASVASSVRPSRASSQYSSEAAPEIVVWTEDMDIDSSSRSDSDEESELTDIGEDESQSPIPANNDSLLHVHRPRNVIAESSLSNISDVSEISSLPSSDSSKATTPFEAEESRDQPSHTSTPIVRSSTFELEKDRLTFNVQPKSSIPTDIPHWQYASECIIAAESSRLNPYALHPDEYHLLRHHISHTQVTTYLNVRNGILRLWLRAPWVAITRQEAIGCANARWFDAANVCFDWLVRNGYINYGCVKIPSTSQSPKDSPQVKRRKTIAVIGAGISGLSCARQLEGLFSQYSDRFREIGEEPPMVKIVEGRGRVGGRVYSREFKTKSSKEDPEFKNKRHTAEMGGMIITGFDRGNPVNVLVRGQLSLPYHALTADTTIYDSDGQPVDPIRDELVEKLYNDCLDRVSEFKYKFQPSKLIEGNRDLIDEGRDSPGDGSKTIMQAEEAVASIPDALPVSEQSRPQHVNMVPVSSDKLTGRVHLEPGTPATLKASEKATIMGWKLKPDALEISDIELSEAIASEGSTLGSVLDHTITKYKDFVDLTPQDHRLINWHIANLEYSNATNLHNLSIGLWDIDAGNEWEGRHTMVVGGYQSVARGLLFCPQPLDLTPNFPVKSITYNPESFDGTTTIQSEDGTTVEADAVVCSVPLGVLKHGNIAFNPPLPEEKSGVIKRLGFGILNKVVLVYDKVFWESDRHIFGVLRDSPDNQSTSQGDYKLNRGRFFQWFNISNTTGLPCLLALMAGDAGFETEHSSNESLVAEATQILRKVFGDDVPYPVESVVTRWGSDKFARGSYSSAGPDMQPDDYDTMARSAGNLFFAGEHTIGTHPATVHGAYLSGLRAASEVLEAMIGPIEVPMPLILPRDSLLLQKRKVAAEDPRQARLDAYEAEIWDHIRAQIGERPEKPTKVAGNAYLLYSKENFELARSKCEEARKEGRAKSIPNEVRVMTSKMWKEATPAERKPYEDQAAEQKRNYSDALQLYVSESEKWDNQAAALRAAYERDHPSVPGPGEAGGSAQKYRRGRNVRYVDDRDSDLEL